MVQSCALVAKDPLNECETNGTIASEINGIYLDVILINEFINKSSAESNDPLGQYI